MIRKEIGYRIQKLRRKQGLSLRGLSRSSGIAVSFLSSLEQGENNVSVAKLKTILDALGIGLSEFFSEGAAPPRVIYRKTELIEIAGHGNAKGISYRDVAAGRQGRSLQVLVERYKKGADTGAELYRHTAEEAGVVLQGKLELTVESEVYTLGPGDAYYFDSSRPHRFRNIGRGELRVISVNTPPSF
jgi:transcriptional regulator with XRE-family HTH domain